MQPLRRLAPLAALSLLLAAALVWSIASGPAFAQSQSSSSEVRIGSVDLRILLFEMLNTEEFAEPRQQTRDALEGEVNEARAELERLSAELQLLGQGDPSAMQLQQRAQTKLRELQQLGQSNIQRFQAYSAEQAAQAYERLWETSRVVAEREGYTHLFATRKDAEIQDPQNPSAVTQEILARSLVLAPEQHDITQLVREELGLPDPAEDAQAEADPEAEVEAPAEP